MSTTGSRYTTVAERIRAHCTEVYGPLETPCWYHTGAACSKGYAYVTIRDPRTRTPIGKRAHRVLWEHVNERAVRKGFTLDHLCRIKRCCRPDHLEEVTRKENTQRQREFERQLRRHSQTRII